MEQTAKSERERLLDPVDRISEILFGLIMAVTIVGSLSIAAADKHEVRTVLFAALGCNLAWGLVDAVMYLVRTATERARNLALARRILEAEPEAARALVKRALPDQISAITGPEEIEGMRRRLLALPRENQNTLGIRDFAEAGAVFLLVVIATFPVVLPFMLMDDLASAMQFARAITLAMLFTAGVALGRHAGYARPFWMGLSMAVFGAVLIVAVMALGG